MGELPTWIQDNMGTDQNAPQNWIDPTNVKKIQEAKVVEEDMKSIEDGHSLEVIERIGFENYRNLLCQTSYSKIWDNLSARMATMDQSTKTPEWMLADKKHSSKKRAIHLREKYLAAHPEEDGDQKFYCDEKIVKKLRIIGREKNIESKRFLRRVYLSVPTANMPEISEELFKTMDRDGLLSQTETAMNMEVYDEEGSSEVNSNKWY
mgnify:CR=1 FL=1